MPTSPTTQPETYADRVLAFTIPSRDARGRVVRLDAVVDEVLAAHSYPAPIALLLAEALVLAALLGSLARGANAQMTMQAQTKGGIVKLLVCDFKNGELRGYCDFDHDRLAGLGANPSLPALFGEGYLAITFDTDEVGGRYQGIVPLEGDSLSDACEAYFSQSEQVPTRIRVAVQSSQGSTVAAGLLTQHLPDGEEGRERLHVRLDHPEWQHVAVLTETITHAELLDEALSLDVIVWRLFHEEDEVRVTPGATLGRGCRCTQAHYETVLARFPEAERAAMRDEAGHINVDCAFCSKQFRIGT